jgi:hypothetical protein
MGRFGMKQKAGCHNDCAVRIRLGLTYGGHVSLARRRYYDYPRGIRLGPKND